MRLQISRWRTAAASLDKCVGSPTLAASVAAPAWTLKLKARGNATHTLLIQAVCPVCYGSPDGLFKSTVSEYELCAWMQSIFFFIQHLYLLYNNNNKKRKSHFLQLSLVVVVFHNWHRKMTRWWTHHPLKLWQKCFNRGLGFRGQGNLWWHHQGWCHNVNEQWQSSIHIMFYFYFLCFSSALMTSIFTRMSS